MIKVDEIQSEEHTLVQRYLSIFVLLDANVNQFYDRDEHFHNQGLY